MSLLIMLWPGPRVEAEDWIGLEQNPPVLLGADLGEDEIGDSYRALLLDLPLTDSAGFYGYYSETELSDADQSFDSLALVSALWLQLNQLVEIEMQHFFEGNEGELEKETLALALGLDQGQWNFRVQLETGEALFFTRDNDSDFFDRFVPDRFSTDVSAVTVSLGRRHASWYWQASYQRIDYEKDLGALDQSLFARFVVKASTLAQSSLLVAQNATLLLGYTDLENDYSVQVSQNQSAIDQTYEDTLLLSWQHWISRRFGYELGAATTLPGEDDTGLTLGLRWML